MPQVSRRILPKVIEQRMFTIFWDSIARLTDPADVETFFNDLLSDVEKIMLAKRLAIAFLLAKKYDYKSIKATLKVSNATIASVNLWMRKGGRGYKLVIDKLIKEENLKVFLGKIEDQLADLFPYGPSGKVLRIRKTDRKFKSSLG